MGFVKELPKETIERVQGLEEIPNKIRFLVEGAPNLESKIATLQKFYPKVEIDTLQSNNFIVTDDDGNQFQLDNKKKTNLGDVIDIGKEISQILGSGVGATVGTAAGPVGTVAGSGAGMAAGSEIFERVAQLYGAEMLRTNKEWAASRTADFAFGSIGQAVAPLILKPFKGALTGFGKAQVETQKRLADYIDAGVSPSLGQVSQKRGVQTVELLLGNFPGSSGKIADTALKAQNQLATRSKAIAESLINKAVPDETVVGRTIVNTLNGVDNPKSFTGTFNSRAGVLFGKIDNYIKPNQLIDLSRKINPKTNKGGTIETLKNLVAPIKGAERTSTTFKNPFLTEIFENLTKDVAKNNGALPYSAVKGVKQKIGKKLSSFEIIPDVDKGNLKLIYGALSEDLKIAAKKYGGDKAVNAITRANKFYEAGLKRIDNYLKPIIKKADPDKIVQDLINSGKEGVTRLRGVKKSLLSKDVEGGKHAYTVLLSNILQKLGRLQPSQTIAGDFVEASGKFSSESFLTNWNKLSDAARKELFKGSGWSKSMIKDLDQVVNISSFIRQSGKTFQNPSGTADRVVGQGLILGGGISAFTGNPLWLLGVPLVIGSSKAVASLMTNPNFIKWLAQGIKIGGNKGMDGIIQHLGKLGVVMANADSETRQFIYEYLQILQGVPKEELNK